MLNNTKVIKSTKVKSTKVVKPVVSTKVKKVTKVKTVKVLKNTMVKTLNVGTVVKINKPIINGNKPSNFTLVSKQIINGSLVNGLGVKVVLNHTKYTLTNPVMLLNRGIVNYMVLIPNKGTTKPLVVCTFKSGNIGLHNHLPQKFITMLHNQHNQYLLNKLQS